MDQSRSGIALNDQCKPDWPPIISGARRPRWIVWRDVGITLCMWGIFLLILEIEFAIVWSRLPSLDGRFVYSNLGFSAIRTELRPAMVLIIILILVLGISTLFSRRRRANALLLPQPSPVADEDLARDLNISSEQMETFRKQKVIVLDVDAQGRATVVLDSARPG